MSTLPRGNYTVLLALIYGHLNRKSPAHDHLLTILETHSVRAERSDVWRATIRYFCHFSNNDRLLDLTSRIFATYPGAMNCAEGAHHVAHMCGRTGDGRLREWLDGVRSSGWRTGGQAFGEILVVLAARQPGLTWITQTLDAVLDPNATMDDRDRIRLGVAYLAVDFWRAAKDRRLSTDLIMRLLPLSTGDVATAVAGIFSRGHSLPADEETNKVLDEFLEHPAVLAAGDRHDLVLQLKNICVDEPDRVLGLCNALLDEAQHASGGVSRLAIAGGDMIDISLTLQRLHGHRTAGLDLFERLLEMGMYGARETLQELNIRPDAKASARF